MTGLRVLQVNAVQRTLVEAWGIVRETYVDPTFNNQGTPCAPFMFGLFTCSGSTWKEGIPNQIVKVESAKLLSPQCCVWHLLVGGTSRGFTILPKPLGE